MTEIMKQKIEEVGKIIEPNFKIMQEQEAYYFNLVQYFMQKEGQLDYDKGLFISGDVGTGKTLSMKIMQRLFGGFRIVSARHLIREFLIDGVKVIDNYGRKSFEINSLGNIDIKKPTNYCFDDLLLEEVNSKFYGNQQNLMAEVLLDRYDMFIGYKMKTFSTTNATPTMLETNYGSRIRDRLKEMCNYVTLTGTSLRK